MIYHLITLEFRTQRLWKAEKKKKDAVCIYGCNNLNKMTLYTADLRLMMFDTFISWLDLRVAANLQSREQSLKIKGEQFHGPVNR